MKPKTLQETLFENKMKMRKQNKQREKQEKFDKLCSFFMIFNLVLLVVLILIIHINSQKTIEECIKIEKDKYQCIEKLG